MAVSGLANGDWQVWQELKKTGLDGKSPMLWARRPRIASALNETKTRLHRRRVGHRRFSIYRSIFCQAAPALTRAVRTVVSLALISTTSKRWNLSASGVLQNSLGHLLSSWSSKSTPPYTVALRDRRSSTALLAHGPIGPMILLSLEARVERNGVSSKRPAGSWQ